MAMTAREMVPNDRERRQRLIKYALLLAGCHRRSSLSAQWIASAILNELNLCRGDPFGLTEEIH